MATRATYQIDKLTFYCHWDGYPTGAAQRFANMVKAHTVPAAGELHLSSVVDRRGGFAFAFIRGNLDAEPTESHQAHGDTEFRYTLTTEGGGFAKIKVDDVRYDNGRKWRQIYHGDLAEWLNQQRAAMATQLRDYYSRQNIEGDADADALEAIPVIVRAIETRDPGWGTSAFAIYATREDAEKIEANERAFVERFSKPCEGLNGQTWENPNKAQHEKKAQAWLLALGEVTGQGAVPA